MTTTYSKTFEITDPEEVMVTMAMDESHRACDFANQAAADGAFATWRATASVTGGCTPTSKPDFTTAPPYCGGSVEVTWTIADHCYMTTTY
jgi:hypothetical protein